MTRISYKSTLFWYDGPQVFEARDAIGGHYLAVAVERPPGTSRHLVVGVPPRRLRRLRAGLLDLRTLLIEAGTEEWYLTAAAADLDSPLLLLRQEGPLGETNLLPDDGFYLHADDTNESTLLASRERHKLVMTFVAEPPEAVEDHRIRVDTLVEILGALQVMVKHAYRAALRTLSDSYRNGLQSDSGHLLDVVVPAAPGSFSVLLEASQSPNLIGESEVARALRRVDELFDGVSNPEKALASAQEHRGHLAGSYLRLLRLLVQRGTGMRYSWAEPIATDVTRRAVTVAEAERLVEALSTVSNLSTEAVELEGEFEKFNRTTGLWGLLTESGKRQGRIRDDGPSLDGLEVGSRYRFTCVEEIDKIEGTGREAHTLYLIRHERS